jgi:hypothetical protein
MSAISAIKLITPQNAKSLTDQRSSSGTGVLVRPRTGDGDTRTF